MIDQNAMALYVKVVENQSFSTTAQRENIPLSTVSRKISKLEKSLNVRLLERSTRQLRTTEIGQEYYQHCRLGLEKFESANLLVSDCQTEVSGTLRISAPPSLSDVIVTPLVTGFQTQHPNVNFRVLVTDRNAHLIEDGIDLTIRMGKLNNSSLVARQLLRYRHMLIATPEYLKKNGCPTHPQHLNDHSLITFSTWFGEPVWSLLKEKEIEKIWIKPRLAINDYSGIQSAVLNSSGIGEIPSIICGQLIQKGQIVEVMPDWHFAPVTCSAVYPSRLNLPRVVRLFKDYCVEHIENLTQYAKL